MRKRVLFSLLFVCFGYALAVAQQDPQITQYMYNNLFFNPAYAGVENKTKFQTLYRTQWTGYQGIDAGGAPNTALVSLNTPILRIRSGFGLYVVNDRLGPQTNTQAAASYSYQFPIDKGKISLGIRAGMYVQTLDFDKYRAIEPNDPVLANRTGKESQVRPDLALGVYYTSEKFYGGLSVNHLTEAEFNFGTDSLKNPLNRHIYINAGYYYDLTYQIVLSPSVLFKSDFNTTSFEVSTVATYNQKFSAGLAFRQGDAVSILTGVSLLKDNSLRIGYSFDYIIKAQTVKQKTSNEFMLTYTLPYKPPVIKTIKRTPRFRND
ncbi:type IX secretion system membrane protein PorP/SprF [Cytophagaceae bacterium DM2B3-1]|uniref:Type IX secretion system membrane protein PorP/SprF n=1 Tax=Xanthocytophaga flava TaxID=3048013 RepID=A0AAE3UA92_9BACT|nr:type IX secretion system membrane protein PorP/SprF [Xanthocytophaga flavus]MDJ1468260.1 type IX secretion system membrane protein PorP/SprF [Xanthocytophaga flavus]MDJ1485296.1 type IX secretion system membrane protein PorP/SprF [Xanthocytophaga flavus]MDJ1494627.1 type IX secretion system membrane protein PorP/SprF [Xanthocytophaga flavus]